MLRTKEERNCTYCTSIDINYIPGVSNSFFFIKGHMSIRLSLRGPPYLAYIRDHKLLSSESSPIESFPVGS